MLTLQFVPYGDIESLDSDERIKKLLDLVRKDTIVVLEGRLQKEEETDLIKTTMQRINQKFKGIELGVIYPDKKAQDVFQKLKSSMLDLLLGDRRGLTIIGPATVVKEIKQDPQKIQLFTTGSGKTSKTKKSTHKSARKKKRR